MPTLNEYLAGIFQSVTRARVMSDLQTVQLAEQYAGHELLRHFAIPRMRFSDVELTIPVAMEGLGSRSELELDPIGNSRFKSLTYRKILESIKAAQLAPQPANDLNAAINARLPALVEGIRDGVYDAAIDQFSKETTVDMERIGARYGLFGGSTDIEFSFKRTYFAIREFASSSIKGVIEKPVLDELGVIAESYRLRDQRPEDLIVIKMKVSEEGMEWQTIERDDGSVERKLLPE